MPFEREARLSPPSGQKNRGYSQQQKSGRPVSARLTGRRQAGSLKTKPPNFLAMIGFL
jgi:hypothetical protein